MIKDREAKEHKSSVKSMGPDLGSVMLGYVLMYDPMWVCEQLDTLWQEPGDKVAHDATQMGIMYYMAHVQRNLGHVDWTCRTSSPTSMVYVDDATHVRSYIVWNPTDKEQTVQVYEGEKVIGQVTAKAQALTTATKLGGAKGG